MVAKSKCLANVLLSAHLVEWFERPLQFSGKSLSHSDPIWVLTIFFEKVSMLQNSKPYPTIKSCCASNKAVRLPLYFLHEHQIIFLGGFTSEFKGQLSLGWLLGEGLFDFLDDVNQVGWPDFVICRGQHCGMNSFG